MNHKQHRLSYRLLFYILLCSSIFTLIGVTFQLYLDYKKDLVYIDNEFHQIQQSYSASIASTIWNMDDEQLINQLEGIATFPNIQYIEVIENGGNEKNIVASFGTTKNENVIKREIPWEYGQPPNNITGTLLIVANLENIHNRLLETAIVILVSQGFKTFFVSLFILGLFYYLVMRHLIDISKYLSNISLNYLINPLNLNRRKSISEKEDVLDYVVQAINTMRGNLLSDITKRKQADEKLNFQASHDALTGLINRREFEHRAERLLSTVQQNRSQHALCFMDLDQFKVVNDTCGHMAGDELLRQLSSLLQNTVRHRDTLARLGGDEFGILMEHCSLDHAHRAAASLQKAIQDYQFSWEGQIFKVAVSIGLVSITESTLNLTELLKQADAACYMAKDRGRNRIHVHHPEDSDLAQRHGEMQWVTRLNHALKEDRFRLYAQAIVPLDASTDTHYEFLIRMLDDKGETIPPVAFLPAAERYNLIAQIDHWVIENALSLLADNPVFLNQINFCSINLSGQSLTEPNMLDFIITQLDKFGVAGEKICFEITETAAISNLTMAMKFISTLKDLGCRFALDDFGSGLSSFAYLKNLPVDYIKIDGMFVKDIVDDPIDHAMVKSINEIGQVIGMQTIAEFVENDDIKEMLREIGVNYAQGYSIGRPQPLDDLLSQSNNGPI
jgi:diguanylate cyclase (GGDEF)-like protein